MEAGKTYIVESCYGCEMWTWNGNVHRENGPAAVLNDSTVAYYYLNELHRVDGPALITKRGERYYLAGIEMTKEKHHRECLDKCFNINQQKESQT